jgi:16S rRNA (cytosine1402-N4)-methyltransferase
VSGDDLHQPVLLEEALQALNIKANGHYVDGTFGRGGHSGELLSRLGKEGGLLALDKDPSAIAEAKQRFGQDARFAIRQASFANLKQEVTTLGWLGQVDGILLDLGMSSPQLDDASRGFSFQKEGPLDMRMDPGQGQSAANWLAEAREMDIARVLKEFGEERFAKRIARAIVKARTEQAITTTGQLAAIIAAAVPTREPGKDPATRSFQAIRIFINKELDDLKACLDEVLDVLKPGGRLVVISFHSLEDRLIKRFIRQQERGDEFPLDLPVTQIQLQPRLRAVGKPVRPTEAEIRANPRARSAIMRVAERLAGAGA